MLFDPTLSEVLISHPPSTIEASDDDHGEEPFDVIPGEEWIARVKTARQAVEILGWRLNELPQLNLYKFTVFLVVLVSGVEASLPQGRGIDPPHF
ncbi:hypothetical protein H5410_011109 [Solanum commersonii]|uniref:Uncharacterized protein n=1 Tax=Solanum commersonii TaxID=4109 RepID=A0A9J6ANQ2_SOLCO|nr:hypothetical protein H5410_011109 [Solanum commersonii]